MCRCATCWFPLTKSFAHAHFSVSFKAKRGGYHSGPTVDPRTRVTPPRLEGGFVHGVPGCRTRTACEIPGQGRGTRTPSRRAGAIGPRAPLW